MTEPRDPARVELVEGAEVSDAFGVPCQDVPRERWVEALRVARDERGYTVFDWLGGVDELDRADAPGLQVVAHVWSLAPVTSLLVRTLLPADDLRLPTLTGVFAGASWHERETAEMFGVAVDGHPGLDPLLLPDGFEGHPLRKSFVLAARAAKPWPGAKEPGESDAAGGGPGRARRRTVPPGVPDPSWGPRPPARPGEVDR